MSGTAERAHFYVTALNHLLPEGWQADIVEYETPYFNEKIIEVMISSHVYGAMMLQPEVLDATTMPEHFVDIEFQRLGQDLAAYLRSAADGIERLL